jgi:hypothetical protein
LEFIVRPYKKEDAKEVVNLLELVFNGWPPFSISVSKEEHWKWKIEDTPTGITGVWIAESNDQIIGVTAYVYLYIKVFDEIQLTTRGADQGTHPEYRGQGVNRTLRDTKVAIRKKQNIRVRYGGSTNPIVVERSRRRGSERFPHRILDMEYIFDIYKHLEYRKTNNKVIKSIGWRFLNFWNKIQTTLTLNKSASIQDMGYNIQQIYAFDERFDVFWDEIKDFYDFIVVRDSEYLQYRYFDKRSGEHVAFAVEKDGKIYGYSVLRINDIDPEYPKGIVLDFLVLNGESAIADSLCKAVIEYFRGQNVNYILYWAVEGHVNESIFRKNDFLLLSDPYNKWISFNNDGYERWDELILVPSTRMFLQIGDSDWY